MRRNPALVAGALLIAASGCASSPETVSIGLQQTAGVTPLFVAQEDRLFEAEGLNVSFTDVGSGSRSIEALAGGSVHIAPATTLSALQAAEQGLDLVVVSAGSFMRDDDIVVNGLVVRSDSKIQAPSDLRSRTIGVNDVRGVNYLMALAALETGGLAREDVQFQELGFQHMAAALDQGRIDAASTMEPYLSQMRASGRVRVLVPGQAVLPAFSMACYVALRSWADAHPKELRAFGRAYVRAVELTNRDASRARKILVTRLKMDPALADTVGLLEFRPDLTPTDIAPLVLVAVRHGLLRREPDLFRLLRAQEPRAKG